MVLDVAPDLVVTFLLFVTVWPASVAAWAITIILAYRLADARQQPARDARGRFVARH